MYPVDLCEVAKREMKEKNNGDLGSWKRAVTTADGPEAGTVRMPLSLLENISIVHSCITTTYARMVEIRLLRVTTILVLLNQVRDMLHV